MSLSDKEMYEDNNYIGFHYFKPEDVKQAIKDLKGKMPVFIENNVNGKPSDKMILFGKACKLIDEVFGPKLTSEERRK